MRKMIFMAAASYLFKVWMQRADTRRSSYR